MPPGILICLARYDWMLFLGADDWLSPVHLARLTDLLLSTLALTPPAVTTLVSLLTVRGLTTNSESNRTTCLPRLHVLPWLRSMPALFAGRSSRLSAGLILRCALVRTGISGNASPGEDIVREGARSRAVLGRELGVPIPAFAYPYGDTDRVVQHLIGACGYVFGLSCHPSLSKLDDSLLALPRIEVSGSEGLREFITHLRVE